MSNVAQSLMMIFLWFFTVTAGDVRGIGTRAFLPLIADWEFAYSSIKPETVFLYHYTSSYLNAKNAIVNVSSEFDFAVIDFAVPTPADYEDNPDLLVFPFAAASLVPQVNVETIPASSVIVLEREVLAQIYMGNITFWNDSRITSSNPNVTFPSKQINVFYQNSTMSLWNTFLSLGLSSFSQEWSDRFGVSNDFPDILQGLSNFFPASSDVQLNGFILTTPNSIGYTSYNEVSRDDSLNYARLIHQNQQIVNSSAASVEAAMLSTDLNEQLQGNYSVNSPIIGAWPFGSYAYFLISTKKVSRCSHHREFFKFLKWGLTDKLPRSRCVEYGFPPLSANLTKLVVQALEKVQCDGKSLLAYENTDEKIRKGSLFIFFLTLAILILLAGLILSGFHVYHFSQTQINLLYSIVFVIGASLTLIAPVIWFLSPESHDICQARLWVSGLGFTILLGTMFSRTWQLRDIYILQKKQFDALKHNVSARSSIMKLIITVGTAIILEFALLTAWHSADPLHATFHVDKEIELEGHFTCSSEDPEWFVVQLLFLLAMIFFGVYVIYQTWSFQRKALLVETRWVLLALYNIVLTVCAIAPLIALIELKDSTLSLIAIVAIDLSGGGIVAAVLLPRVLDKLEWSTHSHSKDGQNAQAGALSAGSSRPKTTEEKPTTVVGTRKMSTKPEISRTPEQDLMMRLQDPHPLKIHHFRHQEEKTDASVEETLPGRTPPEIYIELQPTRRNPEASSLGEIAEESMSLQVARPDSPTSPDNSLRQSKLEWSLNPMHHMQRLLGRDRDLDASTESSGVPGA